MASYIEDRYTQGLPVDLTGLVHWDRLTLSMQIAPDGMSGHVVQGRRFSSISIEGAEFPRGVDFGNCVFTKSFWARKARFGDAADFGRSAFQGATRFTLARFEGDANYPACEFSQLADFSGARFGANVVFDACKFVECLNFSLHSLESVIEENSESGSLHRAIFTRCGFLKKSIFNDRVFLSGPDFSFSNFEVAPEFHNCELHQSANFEGTNFSDERSEGADRSYRTLKLAFEKMGARDEQAKFFALEQKARAKKASTPLSVRAFSEIYGTVSDYGQNFVVPLVFLVVLIILFAALYMLIIPSAMTDGPQSLVGLLSFSVEQMVRPFIIWSDSYKGINRESALALVLRLLATLEAFGGLGLATISLLALRRRFKLD
ncbi:TPA: pentapeptide repeat-containing protein [Burkholderia vietnamiensis]|nr:pentapeptide repeat-containing protein [Burkholderia vietnamiensis]